MASNIQYYSDGTLEITSTATLSPAAQYHFDYTTNGDAVGKPLKKSIPRRRRKANQKKAENAVIQDLEPTIPINHTKTFPLFLKLPLELQLMIWKNVHLLTLKPRIAIFGFINVPETLCGYNDPLILRQICQHTRSLMLTEFGYYDIANPLEIAQEGKGRICFHPEIDLCYFAWPRSIHDNMWKFYTHLQRSEVLYKIKSAAFERLDEFDFSAAYFKSFESLELLLVVKNRLWRPKDQRDLMIRKIGFQFDCYGEGGFDESRMEKVTRDDLPPRTDIEMIEGHRGKGGGNKVEWKARCERYYNGRKESLEEELDDEECATDVLEMDWRITPVMRFCNEVGFRV